MKAQQRIAISNPCYFAFETLHPRFARRRPDGVSIVLTVNSGYE